MAVILNSFNALIDTNGTVVDAGPKKRVECTEQA